MEPITISLSNDLIKAIIILIWAKFLLMSIEITLEFFNKRLNNKIMLLKKENLKNAIDHIKRENIKREVDNG